LSDRVFAWRFVRCLPRLEAVTLLRLARLGQTNGDSLALAAGAVFAFRMCSISSRTKLARLSGKGDLPSRSSFARAFNWFFSGITNDSPLATRLDRKRKRRELPPPLVGSKEPVLSSALLTATL